MTHHVLGSIALALLTVSCAAQGAQYGYQIQSYPAGVIIGPRIEWSRSDNEAIAVRPGWNFADRGDFGKHDDEKGDGPGIGVDYRVWVEPDRAGWFFGGRLDLWWLEIDWTEHVGKPNELSGTTDILVLQPVFEGGYTFHVGKCWRLDLTVGLGQEINVNTNGEDVGEGKILLAGVSLLYLR